MTFTYGNNRLDPITLVNRDANIDVQMQLTWFNHNNYTKCCNSNKEISHYLTINQNEPLFLS